MSELVRHAGWNLMARLPRGRFGQLVATVAIGTVLAGGASLVARNPSPPPTPGDCPSATEARPDGPDPWGGCWPGPLTTGVPSGTTLTAYTGPDTITTDNTVIDGKSYAGCLTIDAANVTIRNSSITCNTTGRAVWVRPDMSADASLLIEDSTISCASTEVSGLGDWHIVARRVDISGCANGGAFGLGITLEDSYIHDLTCCTDNHTDGVEMNGGLWAPDGGITHTDNLTFEHNTIYGWDNNGLEGSNSSIISDNNAQNVLIEKNLFAGGTFTLYCSNGTNTGYVVRDNQFSTVFEPNVGMFGPVIACSAEDGGGNEYAETGLPIDMSPE